MMFKFRNLYLNRNLFKSYCYIDYKLYCSLKIKSSNCRRWVFRKKLGNEILPRRSCGLMVNKLQHHLNYILSLPGDHNYRSFSSEDDFVDYENVDELDDKLTNNLRDFLYPASKDPIINKLKDVSNVQQVFDIVNENYSMINGEHCGQAIISLWVLQRECRNANDLLSDVYLFRNELVRTYTNQLKSHQMFSVLLDLIDKHRDGLSVDALSCTILYLMKMGLQRKENVLNNLVLKFSGILDTLTPGCIPATALSRFILALGGQSKDSTDLQKKYTLIKTLPHVNYWLEKCNSISDHKLVTTCVYSLSAVMTPALISSYHGLTLRMLQTDEFHKEEENLSGIIKSISLLSYYEFNSYLKVESMHTTVVKLMMSLIGKLDKVVHFQQFYRLQKTFSLMLEPAPFERELRTSCTRWVEKAELYENELSDISPELLFCLVLNTTPHKQHRFSSAAVALANKTDNVRDMLLLLSGQLRILTNVKSVAWPKMYNKLNHLPSIRTFFTLLQMASRYMDDCSFSRNKRFEKRLLELLLIELHNSSTGLEPGKLAQVAMFVLAFSEHLQDTKGGFESFIEKLLKNMDQFTIHDCQYISKGFRQFFLNDSENIHHMLPLYAKLEAALTERTVALVEECQPGASLLYNLNLVCRSLVYRKASPNSHMFHKVIERFKQVKKEEITSRSIRNSVYNLMFMKVLLPPLFDLFCDYVVDNQQIILGGTLCKLLHAIYVLGYYPHNDNFLEAANTIVVRDVDNLSGILLLQAAQALSFFGRLDRDIISHIFSIEFLDQLESEIRHGYSMHTFPERIRKSLMELNRSVCLDYPETGVPWFHSKYCQQEAVASTRPQTKFKRDVYDVLINVIKDKNLLQRDVQSIYGHNIDFQLCFDSKSNLLPCRAVKDSYSKVAILLYNDSDFTLVHRRLIGSLEMERRHLEILGYRVASIDEALWNAMYMAEPKAKHNYLHHIIQQCLRPSTTK